MTDNRTGLAYLQITASKGFVDYWNRVAPVGGVDGNRTLFHILPED